VVDRPRDESKRQWDAAGTTGLRVEKAVVNVEYRRDIQPILKRSCVACHTAKQGEEPAGKLDLDADDERVKVENHGEFPGTYARLAMDERGQFGHKPVGYDSWGYPQASRWVRKFQSRRSVLVWKVHGKRLDGFSNDDHPSETPPGSGVLMLAGASVPVEKNRHALDLDFTGSAMPPADAVKEGKVKPLSDEDRRTIARWIDMGCPIDLDEMNLKDEGEPHRKARPTERLVLTTIADRDDRRAARGREREVVADPYRDARLLLRPERPGHVGDGGFCGRRRRGGGESGRAEEAAFAGCVGNQACQADREAGARDGDGFGTRSAGERNEGGADVFGWKTGGVNAFGTRRHGEESFKSRGFLRASGPVFFNYIKGERT
jgi:hypothetical protein